MTLSGSVGVGRAERTLLYRRGVFHCRPSSRRQPARLSARGPPQPAPGLCGSRRCSEGLGWGVVGGALWNRGETLRKAAQGGSEDSIPSPSPARTVQSGPPAPALLAFVLPQWGDSRRRGSVAGNLTRRQHCQRRGRSLFVQSFFLEHPPSPLGACSESGPGPRVPCVVWQNLAQHCRSVRVPAAQVHLPCRVLLVLFNTSSHLLLERTVDPSQPARVWQNHARRCRSSSQSSARSVITSESRGRS